MLKYFNKNLSHAITIENKRWEFTEIWQCKRISNVENFLIIIIIITIKTLCGKICANIYLAYATQCSLAALCKLINAVTVGKQLHDMAAVRQVTDVWWQVTECCTTDAHGSSLDRQQCSKTATHTYFISMYAFHNYSQQTIRIISIQETNRK